jgi:hypothetical protein
MSDAATLERPVLAMFHRARAESSVESQGWIELNPPVRFSSQAEMRFGSRSYTSEQASFIESVVPTALPESPLPLED